jgi:hypothetical protein
MEHSARHAGIELVCGSKLRQTYTRETKVSVMVLPNAGGVSVHREVIAG